MSLPANLFVDTPEMEDVSMHQLGSDVESWPEEIITKVKERLPQTQSMNLMVKFMKKDDENGVATGSVVVNSNDKVAIIPVIIKDFMLHPLDVMVVDSKILPLTQDYFAAAFAKDKIFGKIEEYPTFGGLGRFEDANLWNAVYPPSLGRYAYAASTAEASMLAHVADTIDGKEVKAYLCNPENAKTAARLLSGPHKEAVVKLSNLQPVNLNEFRQGVENLIPRSVAMLRLDGPNKYTLLQNADSVFHPSLTPMTRHEATVALSELSATPEDDINDVDQNGEKLLRLPQPKNNVILAREDAEVPESADEYGHFSVKTKSGVNVGGIVIPRVIGFDSKRVDLKLFVGTTMSTVQPKIWGVRLQNSRFRLPFSAPRVGQTGVFVYQPDRTHALATIPVTIESITEDCGSLRLRVSDLLGRDLVLRMNPCFELHAMAPQPDGSVQLPAAMKWVPTEGFGEVTNSADDYAVKTAGERKTASPVTLISTGYGQYSLRGVDKYAKAMGWEKTNLQGYQAKFLLASLGAGEEKLAAAFQQAAQAGASELHGLTQPRLSSEKIAAARPVAEALSLHCRTLRADLWKEAALIQKTPSIPTGPLRKIASQLLHPVAWRMPGEHEKAAAYLDSGQTVDMLLSLNFVNPTNVMRYVGKLPALKAAVSHLASCLLASRLGMREIPEQATSAAMMRVVEVVDGLEKLRATQEATGQGR